MSDSDASANTDLYQLPHLPPRRRPPTSDSHSRDNDPVRARAPALASLGPVFAQSATPIAQTGSNLELAFARPAHEVDFPRAPEGLAKYLELCSEKRLLSPTDEWLATACRLRATGGPE